MFIDFLQPVQTLPGSEKRPDKRGNKFGIGLAFVKETLIFLVDFV